MNFFRRRKILTGINSLELIPVRISEFEITSEGLVNIKIPKFRNEWLRRHFIPRRRTADITIKLDNIGSAVWNAIDGKRSMEQICAFLQKESLGVEGDKTELEDRVSKFMSRLYQERYITFRQLEEE